MERLGAPVPELSSDLLPKDQVLAPCVSDHSCRSNRHQYHQPVLLVEFDSRACLRRVVWRRRTLYRHADSMVPTKAVNEG